MNLDAVFWGSLISVVVAAVIFIYLGSRVVKSMNADNGPHENQAPQ